MKETASSLDTFSHTLRYTIDKIKQVDHTAISENKIDCFAYGFGFDNPFALLSGVKTSSIKNLFGRDIQKPIISLKEVDKNWQSYRYDMKNLALKANGTSPMLQGLQQVERVFRQTKQNKYGLKILVILSDGLASDAPDYEILKQIDRLKKEHTLVISLYLSDKSTIKTKIVHNKIDPSWNEGAKLMADCASSIDSHTYLSAYLKEYDWRVYPNGKLLIQLPSSPQRTQRASQTTKKKWRKPPKKQHDIIFIHHHHHDKSYAKKFKQLLTPLESKAAIHIWDDKRIQTEENWQSGVDKLLLSAKAVVLIISPDYLASQPIHEAAMAPLLTRAAHNGTSIIPLILQPSRFQFIKWLSCYTPVNSAYQPLSAIPQDKQDEVMMNLLSQVEIALKQ